MSYLAQPSMEPQKSCPFSEASSPVPPIFYDGMCRPKGNGVLAIFLGNFGLSDPKFQEVHPREKASGYVTSESVLYFLNTIS